MRIIIVHSFFPCFITFWVYFGRNYANFRYHWNNKSQKLKRSGNSEDVCWAMLHVFSSSFSIKKSKRDAKKFVSLKNAQTHFLWLEEGLQKSLVTNDVIAFSPFILQLNFNINNSSERLIRICCDTLNTFVDIYEVNHLSPCWWRCNLPIKKMTSSCL